MGWLGELRAERLMIRYAILLLVGLLLMGGRAAAQSDLQIYAPVYGNWCGPNHPVNMSRADEPVDALDASCMRHDYCIAAQGDYSCGCDIPFLRELRSTRWPNPQVRRHARAIYDVVALVPCDSPDGTSYKQTMFAVDLFYDVVSGKSAPTDVLDRWRSLFIGD